jgi:sugar (pentulose or hexulose) kinase
VTEAALIRRDIRGICIGTLGISFMPVNRQGAPLRNTLSWLDTRARKQTERVSSVYLLPKLLWMRDAEPELYRKSHKIL